MSRQLCAPAGSCVLTSFVDPCAHLPVCAPHPQLFARAHARSAARRPARVLALAAARLNHARAHPLAASRPSCPTHLLPGAFAYAHAHLLPPARSRPSLAATAHTMSRGLRTVPAPAPSPLVCHTVRPTRTATAPAATTPAASDRSPAAPAPGLPARRRSCRKFPTGASWRYHHWIAPSLRPDTPRPCSPRLAFATRARIPHGRIPTRRPHPPLAARAASRLARPASTARRSSPACARRPRCSTTPAAHSRVSRLPSPVCCAARTSTPVRASAAPHAGSLSTLASRPSHTRARPLAAPPFSCPKQPAASHVRQPAHRLALAARPLTALASHDCSRGSLAAYSPAPSLLARHTVPSDARRDRACRDHVRRVTPLARGLCARRARSAALPSEISDGSVLAPPNPEKPCARRARSAALPSEISDGSILSPPPLQSRPHAVCALRLRVGGCPTRALCRRSRHPRLGSRRRAHVTPYVYGYPRPSPARNNAHLPPPTTDMPSLLTCAHACFARRTHARRTFQSRMRTLARGIIPSHSARAPPGPLHQRRATRPSAALLTDVSDWSVRLVSEHQDTSAPDGNFRPERSFRTDLALWAARCAANWHGRRLMLTKLHPDVSPIGAACSRHSPHPRGRVPSFV
jgi:hypothetical protein